MTLPEGNYTSFSPRERTQADQRRTMVVTDQHGRRWNLVIDIRCHGFIGAPQPRFTDTLRTPAKYFIYDEDTSPREVTIDYESWLHDIDARQQEWDDHRIAACRALYGERAEIDRPPGREVLAIIGPPPQNRAAVLAAMNGDVPGLDALPEPVKPKRPKTAAQGG